MNHLTHPVHLETSISALGPLRRLAATTLLAPLGAAGLAGCGDADADSAATCEPLSAAEDGTDIFLEDFVDGEPGTWRLVEVGVGSSFRDGDPTALIGAAKLSSRADLQNPDVRMEITCANLDDLSSGDELALSVGIGMDVDRKTGQQSSKLALQWRQSPGGPPQSSFQVVPTSEVLTAQPVNADTWSLTRLPDGRVEIYFDRTDPGSGMTIAGRAVYTLVD